MSTLYDIRSGTLVKSTLYTNGLNLKDALTFNPLSLFSGGKKGVWYDPSDKSTLFQDAAGTIPVTKDGDPIGLMKDKSGNGYHATQTVSASRPTYRTDGILHWLDFDGGDDYLVTSWFTPTTWYSGMSTTLRSGGGFIFENHLTGANNYIYSSTKQLTIFGAPTNPTPNIDFIYGEPISWVSRATNDNLGTSALGVGARVVDEVATTFFVNMQLYSLIVVGGTVPTDTTDMYSYLNKKAGVIL